MRKLLYLLVPFMGAFIMSSCNKNEGLGGSSSIEGYVYNIVYKSDDSSTADTIPVAGEKVYIVYSGDEDGPVADKDVDTNKNGMYRFDFLRQGNYVVYAYVSYPKAYNKEDVAILQHVRVGSGTAQAEPIYIHSGSIKGQVMVQYYDRDEKPLGVPMPPVDHEVHIKHLDGNFILDRVRVSDTGFFIFERVPPGVYEIYTTTEIPGIRNYTLPTETQVIEVVSELKIYDLPEVFNIVLNL